MMQDDFVKIAEDQLDHCMRVMGGKSAEYARGGDKLHNFKRAAQVAGNSPEEALLGMALKHYVSILDIVDDAVAGKKDAPPEVLREKFGDWINYMLLLMALLLERQS